MVAIASACEGYASADRDFLIVFEVGFVIADKFGDLCFVVVNDSDRAFHHKNYWEGFGNAIAHDYDHNDRKMNVAEEKVL